MLKKEEKLIKLIKREQAGRSGNYEEICEILFDEINALVRPVCKDSEESKKRVKKLFVKMFQQINEIDTDEDIHLWLAGFTTVSLYEMLVKEEGELIKYNSGNVEYPYTHIDEDKELKRHITQYNEALVDVSGFMYARDFFKSLTKGQIIVFEMFCYEGFTIEEMESLLNVDSVYIGSELAFIRNKVLGKTDEAIDLIDAGGNSKKKGTSKKSEVNDSDDKNTDEIEAIRAAIASIVNDTVDEANIEAEGYNDIVSGLKSIGADSGIDSAPEELQGDALATTIINLDEVMAKEKQKQTEAEEILMVDTVGEDEEPSDENLEDIGDIDDEIDDDFDLGDSKGSNEESEKQALFGKGRKKADKVEYDDEEDDEDNEDDDDKYDDEDDDDSYAEKKALYAKNKKKSGGILSDKMLKILSVAVPSVAVIIFIIILVTSGSLKKSSTTSSSDNKATTAAVKQTQAATTKAATTSTTAATKDEKKTTEAQTTTAAKKDQNNNVVTEAQKPQTVETQQQVTEAQQQATETQPQATETQQQTTETQPQTTETQPQATETQQQTTETQKQTTTQATVAPTEATTEATTAAPTEATTAATTEATTAVTEAEVTTVATEVEVTTAVQN